MFDLLRKKREKSQKPQMQTEPEPKQEPKQEQKPKQEPAAVTVTEPVMREDAGSYRPPKIILRERYLAETLPGQVEAAAQEFDRMVPEGEVEKPVVVVFDAEGYYHFDKVKLIIISSYKPGILRLELAVSAEWNSEYALSVTVTKGERRELLEYIHTSEAVERISGCMSCLDETDAHIDFHDR